jgi:hypothetical protein
MTAQAIAYTPQNHRGGVQGPEPSSDVARAADPAPPQLAQMQKQLKVDLSAEVQFIRQ